MVAKSLGRSAEDTYLNSHAECLTALKELEQLVWNQPAPGDEESPITWDDVRRCEAIEGRLYETVGWIQSRF